tara:strand:- start:7681 stop:8202 length:522 start_codon:yes stop_codon:yes gene_type:complete
MIKNNIREIFPKYWVNSFIFVLIFTILAGLIGSAFPLDVEQVSDILEQAEELIPVDIDAQAIFLNNYRISLIMLAPVLGFVFGFIVIFQTGMVFGAAGSSVGFSGVLLYGLTALTPFFWLEFIAYAASMTESVYFIRGIIEKNTKIEIKRVFAIIILNFVLLGLGALIEMLFI